MNCEDARLTLTTDEHGRAWEHFWLGQRYQFSNQIPNRRSFTTTEPGYVLADRGLCAWQVLPRDQAVMTATAQGYNSPSAMQAMSPNAAGGEGAMGLLLLLGLAGAAVWAWFNKGEDDFADDYHPMADCPDLPPVYTEAPVSAQGNQTLVTPEELPGEFDGHSDDFEGSSEPPPDELPPELPQSTWPPKSMGAAYDPLVPEQAGEFDSFRRAIDRDGLNPKGNDVLKVLWGVTPGRSRAYQAARKRRDDFAKRLDYYRYEEA